MMTQRRASVQGMSVAVAQSFLGLKGKSQLDQLARSSVQLPREGSLSIQLGRFGSAGAMAA